MSEQLGSRLNPYTESVYNSMVQQGCWYGGWVTTSNDSIVYITSNQLIEQDNNRGPLGCQENPFSETAYNEMMSVGTWSGGYVRHPGDPDVIIYHRSYEEQYYASG